jgi:hypothetical protein
VDKERKKDPSNLMFNQLLKRPVKLRKFGEMCVFTTKDKIQSKLVDKRTTCMIVGYGIDHSSDICRFLNPNTERFIKSRDVIWLRKSLELGPKAQMKYRSTKLMTQTMKNKHRRILKCMMKLIKLIRRRELILDRANLALNVTGKPKEADSFDEAYNNPNPWN